MRRDRVTMAAIAEWSNLVAAFGKAARGKRGRADVEAYRRDLDAELERLRAGMSRGDLPVGRMRRFTIRDPKPRVIHAPCFRERVLHHALMARMGPVLDPWAPRERAQLNAPLEPSCHIGSIRKYPNAAAGACGRADGPHRDGALVGCPICHHRRHAGEGRHPFALATGARVVSR